MRRLALALLFLIGPAACGGADPRPGPTPELEATETSPPESAEHPTVPTVERGREAVCNMTERVLEAWGLWLDGAIRQRELVALIREVQDDVGGFPAPRELYVTLGRLRIDAEDYVGAHAPEFRDLVEPAFDDFTIVRAEFCQTA